MWQKHSEVALLLSGGWDSAACFIINQNREVDLIFFDYGQIYKDNELRCAEVMAKKFERPLRIIKLDLTTDFAFRNLIFLIYLKQYGYKEAIIGSRNLFPLFDKYKDSNWFSLKIFEWFLQMKITLPITGWKKSKIVKFVKERYSTDLYNCYNNWNSLWCDCSNCKEMRAVMEKIQ